jgi:hypothetical protein
MNKPKWNGDGRMEEVGAAEQHCDGALHIDHMEENRVLIRRNNYPSKSSV